MCSWIVSTSLIQLSTNQHICQQEWFSTFILASPGMLWKIPMYRELKGVWYNGVQRESEEHCTGRQESEQLFEWEVVGHVGGVCSLLKKCDYDMD